MNNLRKFDTFQDYEEAELVKPAVSLIAEDDSVFFDQKEAEPEAFGGLTVIYNVEDASNEVQLFNGGGGGSSESESESGGGGALPSRMIIDGNEETPVNSWRFETSGEHTVQYEFEDNTVPPQFLDGVSIATEAIIGIDITNISSAAFNVELTNGATCLSTTPPVIVDSSAFGGGMGQVYPIYVPSDSVTAYQTAWSNLATRIEAIQ